MKLKQYLFLILFGIVAGGIPSLIAWKYFVSRPAGSQFESIDDLRAQMLKRDERDVKSTNSVSLRTLIQPDSSDEIIYKLKPGLDVLFQGVRVVTNSFGMKGEEVSLEKPPDVYRIALLGDSFAFGWGVTEEQSFARIFEKNLNESKQLGKKVEVLNFGVPGYSTFQETASYMRDHYKFNIDTIVVYFVENDFGLPFFIGDGENPLSDAVSFFKKTLLKTDPVIEQKRRQLQSLSNPNKALRNLLNFAREKGTKVMLVVNPGGKNVKQVYSKLWILKEEQDLKPLRIEDDLQLEILEKNIDKSTLKLPTDPHPSPIKHEMIGRAMSKEFLLSLK